MASAEGKARVPMADSEKPTGITDINAKRRCGECGGEHPSYIKNCPLKSSTVIMHEENSQLRERCEQLEELAGLQVDVYNTLNWMIATLDFTNANTGMNAEDSPEMKAAKALRDKLKPKEPDNAEGA